MFHVTFKVNGEPRGKGRARFARMGNFVRTYTDEKTRTYEDQIKQVAQKAMGLSEPLKTALDVFLYISTPVPASYPKKRKEACLNGFMLPTKRPDIDNVAKAVLDAIAGVVYVNDTQIVNLYATKKYGEPFIEVLVRETEIGENHDS